MPVKSEPRIEVAQEMYLIGIRQKHAFAVLAEEIPKQWLAFKMGFEAARQSPVTYGVICGLDHDGMEYMCGVEVSSLQSVAETTGKIIIPQQKYAVFVFEGHITEIGAAWDHIIDDLMPALKLEDAHTPSFERYDDRYDPMSGNGVVEIWCPVK